jgi:serine protease
MAHEDLYGRYVGGYDMISSAEVANDGDLRDPDPSDMGDDCNSFESSSWHGTHVAGTIAAAANNGIGVTGINWQSKILPVRVLGCGGGYTSDIVDGIRWSVGLPVPNAVNNPPVTQAKIINLSLGGRYTCPWSMQDAIDAARARGAVVVAAAGNNAVDAATFAPASCMGVITVGATNRSGKQARYSNYGNLLELSAPGGEIVAVSQGYDFTGGIASTVGFGYSYPPTSEYAYYEGTSMAAPHVSGVVSLMYSINPQLTADLAARILQSTASPFSVQAPCSQCGSGILHAGRAVTAADSLRVLQAPSPYAWAFAGDATAPNRITVVTRQKLGSTPTTVKIGNVDASVVSVLTQNGRDYLTVQPTVLLANGFYSLSATVDGGTYTHQKAVLFGKQLYLPSVRR